MRPSGTERRPDDGRTLALAAEVCYLANLTLAPVVGFLVLVVLYRRRIAGASALARCHLRQAMAGSLWAGMLLVALNATILLAGGYRSPDVLVWLALYFFGVHSALILLGIAGIARALAGKPIQFPLIGVRCG